VEHGGTLLLAKQLVHPTEPTRGNAGHHLPNRARYVIRQKGRTQIWVIHSGLKQSRADGSSQGCIGPIFDQMNLGHSAAILREEGRFGLQLLQITTNRAGICHHRVAIHEHRNLPLP